MAWKSSRADCHRSRRPLKPQRYPTLVQMCGLPKPHQQLEAESLAATLANPETAADRNVFLPHMHPGEYAVINRDWRYIRYGDDGEELYDLRKDPNEWNNLAAQAKYADLKVEMQNFAPQTFAAPEQKLNARKDPVIEGETFRWEKGAGNAQPQPGYVPPTSKPTAKESSERQ